MYSITSTEKHPQETCCYYAKRGHTSSDDYDTELKAACTPAAEEAPKLFWDEATGSCVQSYSYFEYDELVKVETTFVDANNCCTLGKATDIASSSIMFANSVTSSNEPFTNIASDQNNLIMACATTISYECSSFDGPASNCEEVTTGPVAGAGEDQTD